jgi:hypothetical protein
MFHNQPIDFRQFVTPKSAVLGQPYGLQPELRVPASVSNMDVRRFTRLEAVEVEPVPANSQQRRHQTSVSCNLSRVPRESTVLEVTRPASSRGSHAIRIGAALVLMAPATGRVPQTLQSLGPR